MLCIREQGLSKELSFKEGASNLKRELLAGLRAERTSPEPHSSKLTVIRQRSAGWSRNLEPDTALCSPEARKAGELLCCCFAGAERRLNGYIGKTVLKEAGERNLVPPGVGFNSAFEPVLCEIQIRNNPHGAGLTVLQERCWRTARNPKVVLLLLTSRLTASPHTRHLAWAEPQWNFPFSPGTLFTSFQKTWTLQDCVFVYIMGIALQMQATLSCNICFHGNGTASAIHSV